MSEVDLRKKAIERIEALETAVKALLEAQKLMEKETGDEYIALGEYLGIKFD